MARLEDFLQGIVSRIAFTPRTHWGPNCGAPTSSEVLARPRLGGALTFNAEGSSDPKSQFYSRRPHVPSLSSGLTIGRGFDMRERTTGEVFSLLTALGIDEDRSHFLSMGAGLRGSQAQSAADQLQWIELSQDEEVALFDWTYQEAKSDVLRIIKKTDTVERYGAVQWDDLNPKIQDLLVDLRFRGDYTPASRSFLQPLVVKNDLAGIVNVMNDRAKWSAVPMDRFIRRGLFLSE